MMSLLKELFTCTPCRYVTMTPRNYKNDSAAQLNNYDHLSLNRYVRVSYGVEPINRLTYSKFRNDFQIHGINDPLFIKYYPQALAIQKDIDAQALTQKEIDFGPVSLKHLSLCRRIQEHTESIYTLANDLFYENYQCYFSPQASQRIIEIIVNTLWAQLDVEESFSSNSDILSKWMKETIDHPQNFENYFKQSGLLAIQKQDLFQQKNAAFLSTLQTELLSITTPLPYHYPQFKSLVQQGEWREYLGLEYLLNDFIKTKHVNLAAQDVEMLLQDVRQMIQGHGVNTFDQQLSKVYQKRLAAYYQKDPLLDKFDSDAQVHVHVITLKILGIDNILEKHEKNYTKSLVSLNKIANSYFTPLDQSVNSQYTHHPFIKLINQELKNRNTTIALEEMAQYSTPQCIQQYQTDLLKLIADNDNQSISVLNSNNDILPFLQSLAAKAAQEILKGRELLKMELDNSNLDHSTHAFFSSQSHSSSNASDEENLETQSSIKTQLNLSYYFSDDISQFTQASHTLSRPNTHNMMLHTSAPHGLAPYDPDDEEQIGLEIKPDPQDIDHTHLTLSEQGSCHSNFNDNA